MKKKRSILFFLISIALITIQVLKKFDGAVGFLIVVFAVWSMMASVILGGFAKEMLKLSAEALIEALISIIIG